MLRALRTLGEVLGGPRFYDPISADYIIVLDFDKAGSYQGCTLEAFQGEDIQRYLYKSAKGSNPPTLTPTLILNRNQAEKSLKNARNAYRKLKLLDPTLPDLELENEVLWPHIAEEIADRLQELKKQKQ